MATATLTAYNNFYAELLKGNIDFENDTIKLMLVTSSYTPDIDTHNFIDDVSTNEATGTGYTAGGFTLSNSSVSVDNANDIAKVDFDDVTASTVTITYRYVIAYKDSGTPATSPVIGYYDYTTDQSSTAGDVGFNLSTNGLLRLKTQP